MAGSSLPVFKWDKSHEEGQCNVSANDDIHDILIEKIPFFANHVNISEDFLTKARQKDVIDEGAEKQLKNEPTKKMKGSSMIQHILHGHMYQFHGFLWVLTNTGQHKLVEEMGFKFEDYIDGELFMEKSQFRCPSCHDYFKMNAYVMTRCNHYVCTICIKTSIPHKLPGRSYIEEITCPVEGCGLKTEVISKGNGGGLNANFDDTFEAVSNIMKKMSEISSDQCTSCSTSLISSPVKHYCGICKNTLCSGCYLKHQEDSEKKTHESIHQHQRSICCAHGKATTKHCRVCRLYFCGLCSESCDHSVLSSGNEQCDQVALLKSALTEKQKERNDIEETCSGSLDVFSAHEAEIKGHVKYTQERIIREANAWSKEKLKELASIKQEIDTSVTQATNWQKALKELQILVETQPWSFKDTSQQLMEILPRVPGGLCEETMDYLKAMNSNTSVPDFVQPPVQCCIPPRRATFVAEWESKDVFSLEWTTDGDLIVAQCDQNLVTMLKVDIAKKTITPQLVLQNEYAPTDVTCRADGKILVSNKEGQIIVYEKGGKYGTDWNPEEVEKPWCITSNGKYVFVTEADGGSVYMYEKDGLTFIKNQYMCDPPGIYRLCATETYLIATTIRNTRLISKIHEGELGEDSSSNASSAEVVKLGITERDMTRGNHARGLCTYWGRYILVCDQMEDKISVYLQDGAFVQSIDFDNGVPEAWAIAVHHRMGAPALLALGSHQTLKVYTLE